MKNGWKQDTETDLTVNRLTSVALWKLNVWYYTVDIERAGMDSFCWDELKQLYLKN